mgnify:FL=1
MKIREQDLRKMINEGILDMFSSKHNEIPEKERRPTPRLLDNMNPEKFERRIKDIERALSQISGLELESYSEGSTTDFSRMGIEDLPGMRREIVNHLRGVDKLGYINLGGENYGPPPPIANPKQGVVYPESPMTAWKAAVLYVARGGSLTAKLNKRGLISLLLAYGTHKTRRTLGQGVRDLFGGTFFGDNRPERSTRLNESYEYDLTSDIEGTLRLYGSLSFEDLYDELENTLARHIGYGETFEDETELVDAIKDEVAGMLDRREAFINAEGELQLAAAGY